MSNQIVTPDNISSALSETLAKYSGEVQEGVKKAIHTTADELVAALKADSPDDGRARKKKYNRGWQKKIEYESPRELRVKVHNKTAYQLTHLLENGHRIVTKSGRTVGYSAPRVHIKPDADKANEKLVERIEEAAKGR